MFNLWLKFIICAAIVVFSGYRICIYAEKLARILKVGRTFIGLMLLAIVTSLPELAVAISATKIQALDLALGDLFGSNLFNLTIAGAIFLVLNKKLKIVTSQSTHFISAALSVLLISLAALGIILYNSVDLCVGHSIFFLDIITALILAIYALGAYLIYRSEKTQAISLSKTDSDREENTSLVWLRFLCYCVILVGFAICLSLLGNQIAQLPVGGKALGGTFVGSLFIAIATSLPELAVAISAVKLGFLDMALGNIFGSNMFNMFIIPITDLALGRRLILSSVSSVHLFTILFVIISTALLVTGLVLRRKRKMPAFAWDALGIIFIYFVANLVSFYLR